MKNAHCFKIKIQKIQNKCEKNIKACKFDIYIFKEFF